MIFDVTVLVGDSAGKSEIGPVWETAIQSAVNIAGAITAAITVLLVEAAQQRKKRLVESAIDPLLRLIESVRLQLEDYIVGGRIHSRLQVNLEEYYSSLVRVRRYLEEGKFVDKAHLGAFQNALINTIQTAALLTVKYEGVDKASVGKPRWEELKKTLDKDHKLLERCEQFLEVLEASIRSIIGSKKKLEISSLIASLSRELAESASQLKGNPK